jgi:signal peptidase I
MSVLTQNLLTIEDSSCVPRGDAERSGLVAEALRLGGRVRLRVHGESMLPALWPADMVEIAHCSPEEARAGEIVLALRDGRLFLHRLVGTWSAAGFKLLGDSVPGPDPRFSPEAFLGRLVEPKNGTRVLPAAFSRAIGLILCHFGVARRLALKLHAWLTGSVREFQNLEVL